MIIAVPLYLLFSPWMLWSQLPITDWLRWLGVGLGIVSLPFLTWVQHTLGKHWTVSLELQEEHKLVTTGPYRRVRQPMYCSHSIFFFWVLVSANLLLLINHLFTTILIVARIPKEEKMLLDQFGHEYRAYMKRTGRLLPRFRREADKEE